MKKYFKEPVYIKYANCHEDADILVSQVPSGAESALSICSGGDNTFSLLTTSLKSIYCLDINPVQLALAKIKATAIKHLSYQEYLIFIGITQGDSYHYYLLLRPYLEKDILEYFDNHQNLIRKVKLVNSGKFEHYFCLFKKYFLRFTHSKKVIKKFMSFDDLDQQYQYFLNKFNNWRFRLLFKIFFSEKVMKKHGRDPEYFKYLDSNLINHLKKRIDQGFKHVLNKDNPYIQYVLLNKFVSMPHYLKEENFKIIKEKIDSIIFVKKDIKEIESLNQKFDFYNLSDIFEYLGVEETALYEKAIYETASNGAQVVFWNMLVNREFSKKFIEKESSNLFLKDQCFYYQDLKIYEVKK